RVFSRRAPTERTDRRKRPAPSPTAARSREAAGPARTRPQRSPGTTPSLFSRGREGSSSPVRPEQTSETGRSDCAYIRRDKGHGTGDTRRRDEVSSICRNSPRYWARERVRERPRGSVSAPPLQGGGRRLVDPLGAAGLVRADQG